MKKTMTLALAASIFTFALSVTPHNAAASSTVAPPKGATGTLLHRASGDAPVKYMEVVQAVGILFLTLLS
jgi:hypothetical protein